MTPFRHGLKPVIGLIGAIGAGKSSAARCFATRGGWVIDADRIGHDALRQPSVVAKLVARWSEQILRSDGTVDRSEIGKIVFADATERNALETLVFPYIGEQCRQEITKAQNDLAIPFVVLDAAVMLEAGWNNEVDWIVYVDAPLDIRLERLAKRSGWTPADLKAREAAQLPDTVKKSCADTIIANASGLNELQDQVDRFLFERGIHPDSDVKKANC